MQESKSKEKFSIEEYINNNCSTVCNFNDAIIFLNELFALCDDNGITLDPDLIIELLKNNNFASIVELIYDQFKLQIKSGKAKYIFNSSIFIMIIEMYCDLNNIQIEVSTENIELDYSDCDKAFISQILKNPTLTSDEEKELFIKYQNGEETARKKIINSNLRLVVSIANKYKNKGLELSDLIQEGTIGLMKAIEKFKLSKKIKFSTYATWWIKQEIMRSLTNKSQIIRVPVYQNQKIIKFNKIFERLECSLGREPSIQELANEMNESEDIIKEYFIIYRQHNMLSLNLKICLNDDYIELQEFVPSYDESPEDQAIANGLSNELIKLIQNFDLTDRQKKILYDYYFQEKTLEVISKEFNVSLKRIRQLRDNALEKLRKSSKTKSFDIYSCNLDTTYQQTDNQNCEENKKSLWKYKTIYEVFNNYSKEEVDSIILALSDEEKNLLIYRHGPNFDIPCANKLTKQDENRYITLKAKIRKLLSNPEKIRTKTTSYTKGK